MTEKEAKTDWKEITKYRAATAVAPFLQEKNQNPMAARKAYIAFLKGLPKDERRMAVPYIGDLESETLTKEEFDSQIQGVARASQFYSGLYEAKKKTVKLSEMYNLYSDQLTPGQVKGLEGMLGEHKDKTWGDFMKENEKKAKVLEDANKTFEEAKEKVDFALYEKDKADKAREALAKARKEVEKATEKYKPYLEIAKRFDYLEQEAQQKNIRKIGEGLEKDNKKKLFPEILSFPGTAELAKAA